MKNQTIDRFSPLKLKNGKILLNRVIVPPMASETADQEGFVTENTLAHYTGLTESKAGFIVVEYSFVHISGRSEEKQLGVSSDAHLDGLKALSYRIHQQGALAGIQLTHSGGKTESRFTDSLLYSPSGIIVPVKDKILEKPSEMNLEDINNWKKWFVEAAHRASLANFDLIELHAAHGYGLNQWLSPITNKRCDKYGGSVLKNIRLILEIIESIKSKLPYLLISVRIPGQDFLEGGLSTDDCILIAKLLQNAGIDIINVSSGIGGWRRPGTRNGEGYLVEEASRIQKNVSIPVIGVGGIETGAYIDDILKDNKISLAAVGRAILKDPKGWGHAYLMN
ncbi:MAG: NADH:flavin oxidoreductase [Bacteriovoracaceae bacterium]